MPDQRWYSVIYPSEGDYTECFRITQRFRHLDGFRLSAPGGALDGSRLMNS